MKKILIINGHPDKESLCFALAESYKKGADTAGAVCKLASYMPVTPLITFAIFYKRSLN